MLFYMWLIISFNVGLCVTVAYMVEVPLTFSMYSSAAAVSALVLKTKIYHTNFNDLLSFKLQVNIRIEIECTNDTQFIINTN